MFEKTFLFSTHETWNFTPGLPKKLLLVIRERGREREGTDTSKLQPKAQLSLPSSLQLPNSFNWSLTQLCSWSQLAKWRKNSQPGSALLRFTIQHLRKANLTTAAAMSPARALAVAEWCLRARANLQSSASALSAHASQHWPACKWVSI